MEKAIFALLVLIVMPGCQNSDSLVVYYSDTEARDWITGKSLKYFYSDDPFWGITKVNIKHPDIYIQELELVKEKLSTPKYDNVPQYAIDETPFKFAFLTENDTLYLNYTLSTWYYRGRCGHVDSSRVIVDRFSKYNEWQGIR